MAGFRAVLRVRVLRVADFSPAAVASLPPVASVLVPLWTTIAEHDGAEHAASGDECSIAICDLDASDARGAAENWGARRAFFPFLAEVRDQSVPREVRVGGVVDGIRSRLTRLLGALGTAGNRQSPVIEIGTDDVRALRQLVLAEMARVAPAVVETATESQEPTDAKLHADAPVFVMPDSVLDRIARALGVGPSEEAVLHEIHRVHQALADVRGAHDELRAKVDAQRSTLDAYQDAARLAAAADTPPADLSGASPQMLRRWIGQLTACADAAGGDQRGERADALRAENFVEDLLDRASDRIADILTGRGKP